MHGGQTREKSGQKHATARYKNLSIHFCKRLQGLDPLPPWFALVYISGTPPPPLRVNVVSERPLITVIQTKEK